MDRIASVLLQFPPQAEDLRSDEHYNAAARAHVRQLNQLVQSEFALLASHAPGLLQHLDPTFNTISYAYLLDAIFQSGSKSSNLPDDQLECTARFLLTFDARQIRYAGTPFSNILNILHDGHVFPNSVAVELLVAALTKIDPTGSMFTSHHLPLLTQAYQTENTHHVLPIVRKSIVFYPGMRGQTETRPLCDVRLPPSAYISIEHGLTARVSSSDVMEYDLLCGLIHLHERDFAAASAAFERVCTFPTRDGGCSNIMAHAYIKWVLVNLIRVGKLRPVSSMGPVGAAARRAFETLGKPYLALAKAFEKSAAEGGAEELKKEIEDAQNFWAEDANTGLVEEVQQHYQKHHILRLRDVYHKISLDDILTVTHSAVTGSPLESTADIESLLHGMISTGLLAGILEKPPGTAEGDGQGGHLTFLPEGEELTESQFISELQKSAGHIRSLEPVIKTTDERLASSRDYVRHLVKEQRREATGGQSAVGSFRDVLDMSGLSGMGMGMGGFGGDDDSSHVDLEDEDLMTGVQVGAGGGLGD
ncbi:hypothetical protein GE09DRAFT_1122008 [Coniochaeta sp. 2T2.1]|nr:hypothetical protein GE09DRAFT_1122008 [Coniochaeta sp. 2T2.1]